MQAIIQIIKVTKDGRAWSMQDAECILLNDDGTPNQVGVLQIPKELREKGVAIGTYTGSFALKSDLRTRRIEAVLTGLAPYATKRQAAAPAAS